MENWPVSLQQKLDAEGFSHQFGTTTIRTDMDIGPAKVRSRFTDAVDVYSSSIIITFDEYTTIRTFYKTLLNNGTLPFTYLDPFTGEEQVFRFLSAPTFAALGGRAFKVALSLEKLP